MRKRDAPQHQDTGTRDEVWLSLLVAACLLAQAVVAKELLDVTLDYVSQFAALWVFIPYLVTGPHQRSTSRAYAVAVVAVTAAVLLLYAL